MEKKWTPERKQELIESRAGLTRLFVDAISNTKIPPKAFVSGCVCRYRDLHCVHYDMTMIWGSNFALDSSAVGIYPTDSDKTFDETYQGPWNPAYSGQLVSEWENASKSLEQKNPSIRRAVVRTGVVLSRSDGALPQLVLPFGLAVSGRIGCVLWCNYIDPKDRVRETLLLTNASVLQSG
jgi:NAD dependent epimerase/dehydratase family enzyme